MTLVDQIIHTALTRRIDITPADRKEWALYACALKVLGYGPQTFIDLSALAGTPGAVSRRVWRNERNPQAYVKTTDQACKKILYFAKLAGVTLTDRRADFPSAPLSRAVREKQPGAERLYVGINRLIADNARVPQTALYAFLRRLFPEAEISRVLDRYKVGATDEFPLPSDALGTSFPYINAEQRCVDVKLMAYDRTGHRLKHGYTFNWLLSLRGVSAQRAEWPLFGEHLLALSPGAAVGLVESEKTALICALAFPKVVWVACGSMSNLTERRLEALRNRQFYVYPDADGIADWKKRCKALTDAGFRLRFCGDIIIREAKGPKDDLADIIIRRIRPCSDESRGHDER